MVSRVRWRLRRSVRNLCANVLFVEHFRLHSERLVVFISYVLDHWLPCNQVLTGGTTRTLIHCPPKMFEQNCEKILKDEQRGTDCKNYYIIYTIYNLQVLLNMWEHMSSVKCLQNPQVRQPGVITGDWQYYALLRCPNDKVACGLPCNVQLPLHLVPVAVVPFQVVGATFLVKVKALLFHRFLKGTVPPSVWTLHLNNARLSNETIRGGTKDPRVSQP